MTSRTPAQPPTQPPTPASSPIGLTERDRVILQDHTDALRADVEARALEQETVRIRLSEVAKRLGVSAAEVRRYAEHAGIVLPPPRRGETEPRLSLRQVRDINLAIDLEMSARVRRAPAGQRGTMRQPAGSRRTARPAAKQRSNNSRVDQPE